MPAAQCPLLNGFSNAQLLNGFACGLVQAASATAGNDDLGLPPGPVVDDLGARHGQRVVRIDVVEVTEAEQDMVDRLLGILGLEALDEQRQALVGRPPGSLTASQ
jgi:hypothetical protein